MFGTRARSHAKGPRFIDPKILTRIDSLELVARTVVGGFLSGLHRSAFLGLSIDFAEHRAYMPGDDIRRIDWRLFGRTDRLYIKEFEADTNANFSVVLDISRSMDFGYQGITKLDYGKFMAASLAYLSSRQRDRVGLVTFDSDIVDIVPPSAKHLETVLHTLDRTKSTRAGNLGKTLPKIAERFARRSVVVLISDFYEDPKSVIKAVVSLRQEGNDVIVFHVLDAAEINFTFDRAINFEDLETGEQLAVVPEVLREQYRNVLNEHLQTITRLMGDNKIDYAFFDTSTPLDLALFKYLSNRQRLSRVR
ncbi:MAG: DUF58 domain-containing protein [Gemmatimonadetes bacterium]|nr:DUF58 domain-containing protein [Gemmatimonadota bacterium]